MIKQVILATDGSETASEAARLLPRLGLPAGTPVQLVCVVDRHVESILEVVRPNERSYPDRVLDGAMRELEGSSLAPERVVRSGDPSHELVKVARESGADLIVMGHRGTSGLEEFVLGSVARNVAKHAPCSVLVVRGEARTPRRVLLGYDHSAHAQKAVALTGELIAAPGSAFRLIEVVKPANPVAGLAAIGDERLYQALNELEGNRRHEAAGNLRAAAASLQAEGREVTWDVRMGDPAREILHEAGSFQPDLIAAGARGASMLENLVLGSVADRLLRGAQASVLLVR